MSAPRPYQVCLYVGTDVPALDGVRIVDLTPAQPTPDAVLDRLRDSGLTPSDLRSRVLFVADGGTPELRDAALLVYAALLGFAKRRLDVAFGIDGEVLEMAEFDALLRRQPDAGRPEAILNAAQVGGPARDDLPHVDISAGFAPSDVSVIRYTRRLRFVPPAALGHALPQLVALAALRARGDADKLPYLCTGLEPAPSEDVTEPAGVCLDTLRRGAEEFRRAQRTDNREAFADKVELTGRLQRLAAADQIPLADVLTRLGARSKTIEVDPRPGTPEFQQGVKVLQEVWHCPRPQRHTNGDATPSARISTKADGGFQCFRCDRERVKALRLVMDVHGCSPDEAADWLLTPQA